MQDKWVSQNKNEVTNKSYPRTIALDKTLDALLRQQRLALAHLLNLPWERGERRVIDKQNCNRLPQNRDVRIPH